MQVFLGVDLSATVCDFCLVSASDSSVIREGSFSFAGFSAFLEELTQEHTIAAFACEYTGGIGGPWLLAAERAGVPSFVLHVTDRKAYQRLLQQFTKTDKADARTIARMLAIWHSDLSRDFSLLSRHLFQRFVQVQTAWQVREYYADVVRSVKERTAATNRAAAARNAGQETRAVAWEQIASFWKDQEGEFTDLATAFAREHYAREFDLLLTIPSVGPRVALAVIGALMPLERFYGEGMTTGGRVSDKTLDRVFRYAGFVPKYEASGGKTLRNERYHGGHREFRALLFIAALSASSSGRTDEAAAFYQRLVGRGCPRKKAVYLTAKKILAWCVGVLRSGKGFQGKDLPQVQTRPDHLLSVSEAAELAGLKRTTFVMRTKSLGLSREVWGGRDFLDRREVEPLIEKWSQQATYGNRGRKKKGGDDE